MNFFFFEKYLFNKNKKGGGKWVQVAAVWGRKGRGHNGNRGFNFRTIGRIVYWFGKRFI